MRDDNHSMSVGLPERDEPLFVERMIGIVERDRKRVEEHRGRFFEREPCFRSFRMALRGSHS